MVAVEGLVPIRRADPLLAGPGERPELLLGNQAIVRGAIEAGVGFASGYPGTPSSEVTDGFARIHAELGIVFEYSVNEKVALEMAYAASLGGARSICAMKHLGLMAAGDPMSTIPYVGVGAGMLIVSAGDPSCTTSPNEQDQRWLGPMLHLPILDPSTPQEAHDMARFAFDLSEGSRLPVLLRVTTRVCHTRAPVRVGPPARPRVTGFVRDPARWTPVPANARRMRLELAGRLAQAGKLLGGTDFFRTEGPAGPTAVLATGAPAAAVADVLREIGAARQVALLTLGIVHPLPEDALAAALRGVERLLVVEELSPFLEDATSALCARRGLPTKILGKRTGHFPDAFEYDPATIRRGLHDALGIGEAPQTAAPPPPVVARPPSLCPGCPHRTAYVAARAAFGDDVLTFNDIGCYTLGYGAPLDTVDALLCMGAGFTLAAGVSRVTGKRTVGFLGDSTFFHSGMPALLDAIKEDVGMVAVVLDNHVTAMTGFQESPVERMEGSIEEVVRALGARQIEVVDPEDLAATVAAFRRARDAHGLAVVIVSRACPVWQARREPAADAPARAPAPRPFVVDPDRCRSCGRAGSGGRCDQCLTPGFERVLGRSRAVQTRAAAAPELAPCTTACPLGLCIEGYAGHIAAGEYLEALGHVMTRTPLAESVCRVCDRPCETRCLRRGIDEPVAINDLKRFLVDWAGAQPEFPWRPPREPASGMKVVVVGAGPSGLAAASELALRGHEVALLDAAEHPGGLLARGIPEYRLPRAMVERDIERVLAAGVTFRGGVRLGVDVTLEALLRDYQAVYLAIGAWRGKKLVLPGAGGPGAPTSIGGLDYLEAVAIARPAPTGRRVVVVGGGNTAIDAARTALRRGAARVVLACLESRQAMPALPDEIAAAEVEGVEIMADVRPSGLDAGGVVVESLSSDDRPAARITRLPADLVILAVGQAPDLAFLDGKGRAPAPVLDRAADGTLKVDPETGRTSHPRVFAGGDVVAGARTVTAAMGSGLRAAWGIDRLLRGPERADRRAPPPLPVPRADVVGGAVVRAPRLPRRRPRTHGLEARTADFVEVNGRLDEASARAEAARCLMCGRCGNCRVCVDVLGCPAFVLSGDGIAIDPLLCIGCGVCVDTCPNDAIHARTDA